MQLVDIIEKLALKSGVTGRESPLFQEVRTLARSLSLEELETKTGSLLFVRKSGKPQAKKILLDAHLDEIGLLVREITEEGFVKVINAGGFDTTVLMGNEVEAPGRNGEILRGVVSSTPPHLQKKNEDKKRPKIEDLSIDFGYSKESLEKILHIGDPISFLPKFDSLLNGRAVAKSIDDRICVAIILRVLELLKDARLDLDVYALFSSQEEVLPGLGASGGAFAVKPDYAIALDVAFASFPDTEESCTRDFETGAMISYSAATSRLFTEEIIRAAKDSGIAYTTVADPSHTGTNNDAIVIAGEAVATAVISVPIRNMHSPGEVFSIKDAENVARLTAKVIEGNYVKSPERKLK